MRKIIVILDDLPRDKHYRFLEAAYRAALLSPGAGRDSFRHGCVIVHKKEILVVKYNEYKTHPKCLYFSTWPFLHSESRAILSLGLDNCYKTVLYVVRVMKNNHIALSKPCKHCTKLINHVGIKAVYFSTYEGIEQL